ncbi:MAG: hypothetical protein ACYDAC_09775 [Candidatus Dormibacteria bacterium]
MSHPHRLQHLRLLALSAGTAAALVAGAPLRTVASQAPTFGPDAVIAAGGGEPSIAIDDFAGSPGEGNIYVDSPSTIKLFTSSDGGYTFNSGTPFDTTQGLGGDTDVAVASNGNVVVTDLDVADAFVQVSADQGKTFNTGTATGYEDDRPWLTTAPKNVVYLFYHDFVAEVPVVCTSLDGGQTFTSCFQTFGGNQSVSDCAENTIPSRSLAVDPSDGSLNLMYACSTAAQNAGDPPYGPLHDFYVAHSAAVVNGVAPAYTTLPVFRADTTNGKAPNYSSIFSDFRIDSAGNYYALFAGTADDNNVLANPYHVLLVTSTDHGNTWSAPKQVDQPSDPSNPGTNVFPDMTVTSPGNVDFAWYHSAWTGEPNGACAGTVQGTLGNTGCTAAQNPFPPHTASNAPGWNAYFAQTSNALAASPTFTQVVVNSTATHYGQICTNGIVCGSSDRSLLDFLSIAVDCNGFAHVAYPGNNKAETGGTDIHLANQSGGTPIAPPASCTPSTVLAESPLAAGFVIAGLLGVPVAVAVRRRRRNGGLTVA